MEGLLDVAHESKTPMESCPVEQLSAAAASDRSVERVDVLFNSCASDGRDIYGAFFLWVQYAH
jgi:hypothetical protein